MRRRVATAIGRVVLVALLSLLALGSTVGPVAQAQPPGGDVDPTAATPTAPDPVPPLGEAPDGSTVGGAQLADRGLLAPAGSPALPAGISARSWVIADATSGTVLAAVDPHGRYYPASTLKLLTLLALQPNLDPAEVITATVEDEQIEGSRVGLINGGSYDVQTLWLALMLQSGNDAANALSRTAGGLEVTLEAMNRTATALQAYDTTAGGPSGLDVAGQRTSAYDLALFIAAASADPEMLAIMSTPQMQMPGVPGMDPGFQIQNENRLLSSGYPGVLAGKTGFTDAARHTFAAAAERDGRRLVVSLMGAEQTPVPTWQQAAALLDWGFTVPAGTPAMGELVPPLAPGQSPPAAEDSDSSEDPTDPGDSDADSGAAGTGANPAESTLVPAAEREPGSPVLPMAMLVAGTGVIVVGTTISMRRDRRRPTTHRAPRPGIRGSSPR